MCFDKVLYMTRIELAPVPGVQGLVRGSVRYDLGVTTELIPYWARKFPTKRRAALCAVTELIANVDVLPNNQLQIANMAVIEFVSSTASPLTHEIR